MSAHQAQPEASTPISADALTDFIADQFLGGAGSEEDDENQIPEGDELEGNDPEGLNEDDPENPDDEDADEPEAPAIAPPISWAQDAKELFEQLPPDLQAKVADREAQREKAIQTATTSAANAKREATVEAQGHLAEFQRHYAAQLEQIAASLAPQKPDLALSQTDPVAYVQALAIYDAQNAQHQEWMQQAAHARAEAQQRDNLTLQHKLGQDNATLAEKWGDDWTDPAKRQVLLTSLHEVGATLGYSPELIRVADAGDLLALKTASEWKAKADQFDQLMRDKPRAVQAAKSAPRVAKPGTSRDQAGRFAAKRDAAWQRAKSTRTGDDYAAVLENMGINLG